MSAIFSFAKSGMWDFKNVLAPVAMGTPLAIESGILAKNLIQNPGYLKKKIVGCKNYFTDHFCRRINETALPAFFRIGKNCLLLLFCLSLMAGAAFLSFYFLPTVSAAMTAISLCYFIGKVFVKANAYKQQLIEAFTAKPKESTEEARKRIRTNILKAVIFSTGAMLLVAMGTTILIPWLQHGFSWDIPLPFQTKAVVFLEYAAVALLHGYLAYQKCQKGEQWKALFHLFKEFPAL